MFWSSFDQWHNRFGHPPSTVVAKIISSFTHQINIQFVTPVNRLSVTSCLILYRKASHIFR
jgi:hypothetical protein